MKSVSLSNKGCFVFFCFFFGGGGGGGGGEHTAYYETSIMLQCIESCILFLPVRSCLLLFCSLASYTVHFNMLNLGEDSIPSIH